MWKYFLTILTGNDVVNDDLPRAYDEIVEILKKMYPILTQVAPNVAVITPAGDAPVGQVENCKTAKSEFISETYFPSILSRFQPPWSWEKRENHHNRWILSPRSRHNRSACRELMVCHALKMIIKSSCMLLKRHAESDLHIYLYNPTSGRLDVLIF